ncbi:hypothetical protein CASFOL_029124 [Castilleja foliolosa]|uniref:Uncharacterized protein n=1 Tax=Castilleja foliolosa TaxID=1961234 RepID=A0ABD3CFF9_9LAMI
MEMECIFPPRTFFDHHSVEHTACASHNADDGAADVSIRIIGPTEHEHDRVSPVLHSAPTFGQLGLQSESFSKPISTSGSAASELSSLEIQVDGEAGDGGTRSASGAAAEGVGNNRDSSSMLQARTMCLSGLRENEHALYARLWSNLLILDRLYG